MVVEAYSAGGDQAGSGIAGMSFCLTCHFLLQVKSFLLANGRYASQPAMRWYYCLRWRS